MTGDVTVVGMVSGRHVIEDIGYSVSLNQQVTIPGNLALVSKDLWRAISSRCLFQLKPTLTKPTSTEEAKTEENLQAEISALRSQLALKDKRIQDLEVALVQTQKQLVEFEGGQAGKLDAILNLLKDRPQQVIVQEKRVSGIVESRETSLDLVQLEVPAFIPATIRPEITESQVEVQSSTSTSSGVEDASSKLRQLRKKQ